ncbi:MAG: CDP-alcohol phosphatidyltransferase family protein [Acidobacteria bacterium]|nr:CDP-alcohol phosphatidyltransferase family protein [Acidobacteriota bacterium]
MTYANQLTILRMIFVPVIVLLLVYQHFGWALLAFVLAGLTDALDGLIARRFGQKTTLGQYLDPIADKLLLVSTFIALSLPQLSLKLRIPLWLTITAISRDLLVVLSSLIIILATSYRSFKPSVFGKLTTFFQLLTVFYALVGNTFQANLGIFTALIWLALSFTIISGLHYLYRVLRDLTRYGPS